MGIFSSIKDAVFGNKTAATARKTTSIIPSEIIAVAPQPVEPETVSDVDVIANLEAIDASDGRNLNWRSSIVDLMKMLGMESSLQERKDLAMELGYTGSLDGSADMNLWLHQAVMRELAKHGGRVPAEFLD
jgi:hypothetical protein